MDMQEFNFLTAIENRLITLDKVKLVNLKSLLSELDFDKKYSVPEKNRFLDLLLVYIELKKGLSELISISNIPGNDLSSFNLSKTELIEIETRITLIKTHFAQILRASDKEEQFLLYNTLISSLYTFLPEISSSYSRLFLLSENENLVSWNGWIDSVKKNQSTLSKIMIKFSRKFPIYNHQSEISKVFGLNQLL